MTFSLGYMESLVPKLSKGSLFFEISDFWPSVPQQPEQMLGAMICWGLGWGFSQSFCVLSGTVTLPEQ